MTALTSPRTTCSRILVVILAATLGAVGAACSETPETVTPLAEWALDSNPRRIVGDSEDSDSATFVRITDARVLPSGVLVVADGGASEVHFFDENGSPLAHVGRKGRGPGEFTGAIRLAARDSTSVAIWDPALMRWSVASPSSAEVPATATGGSTANETGDAAWVHAGILVRSEGGLVPSWAPALLKNLADSGSRARVAFVDASGILWAHRDTGRREWIAYVGDDAKGAGAIGYVVVPAGMRVTQFTKRTVVGVRPDLAGYESVLELGFSRPELSASKPFVAATSEVDSATRGDLMVAMRNAVVAQEMHYAEHGTYTSRTDSLSVEMPLGTRLAIISADARSWSGIGVQASTGFSCGMFIGVSPPRGWGEGRTLCGW